MCWTASRCQLTATLFWTERRASQRWGLPNVWDVTRYERPRTCTHQLASKLASVSFAHKCMDHHIDLGFKHSCETFGINLPWIVESVYSSAKSFARRQGSGKQRHVQTRFLWIQDMIASNSFVIRKLSTASNVSDILTKAIDRKTLDKHLLSTGFVEVTASKMRKQS